MSRLLILGYGNQLRGDDAIGPLAAERLQSVITDPEIEIRALRQLTPELMEPISRAARVIFIDAALGSHPGEIAEREVEPRPAARPFTHHATPESLLAAATALYGAAPPATIITVAAAGFEIGQSLSEHAQKALEDIVGRIAHL